MRLLKPVITDDYGLTSDAFAKVLLLQDLFFKYVLQD